MQLDIFTLFPEAFDWFRGQRHVRNAVAQGSAVETIDIRDSTTLSGRQVDDTPFGGGAGMVLRVDVIEAALRNRYGKDPAQLDPANHRIAALTPSGRLLDDALVDELLEVESVTLLCGRYEGFDERILDHFCTDRISIGRYVLAGGEIPAMVVADSLIRKLPGALGDDRSAEEESYSKALDGAPEYPHYTRPAEHRGWGVPDVLLSGNHALIEQWRIGESQARAAAERAADSA